VVATDQGIVPINVLPRKVNPCTWKRILEYWENPIGDREPEPSEIPNEFEFSILDGVLTADQKDALHINRIEADLKAAEEAELHRQLMAAQKPQPIYSVDDLVSAFGEDAVKEANGGELPTTEEEITSCAEALGL
jgi:hypothetical protein